jgi:hypothetical protein
MPQETNLNVAPYFDDFDATNNYNKVLFKPAYPIQARELNTLQSILQGQIESMADNLFQEGSVVIPGNTFYDANFSCIQIQSEFLGIPVSLYLDQLVGKRITGRTSGVTAKVVTTITNAQSDRGTYTLYVNYENSSSDGTSRKEFFDDEVLTVDKAITFSTTFIAANEGFANTITNEAAQTGTAFTLSTGIYYLRGNFVTVSNQILILDQYSTNSSYRIGFQINEEYINADDDPQLYDNASGFNNYTAPGADRLKITATLVKKSSDDYDTQGFIQIAETNNGFLTSNNTSSTQYSTIGAEMAQRTFEESGHYYIKEFTTKIKESLNNLEGNRGVYKSNQATQSGNNPNENLMIYQVSPGKAYVRGYMVDLLSTKLVDVVKPRTTKNIINQGINFNFVPTFEVNNVFGSAPIGFNTTNTISLRNQRVGTAATIAAGKEIGQARIYDFALESGAYDSAAPKTNVWDLSLFDLEVNTDLTVNVDTSLSVPTHIEGENSGASGFLRYSAVGTAVTIYNTKGEFVLGERIKFDGIIDNARFITNVNNNSISDVKSVHAQVGSGATFSADLIQSSSLSFQQATLTAIDSSTGISTVTSPSMAGNTFVGVVTTGNLISFQRPNLIVPSIARVSSVGSTNFTVTGVTTVTNVADGALPSATFTATGLEVLTSRFQQTNGTVNERSLFSVLPKKFVQSVNLDRSSAFLRVRKEITIANGETGVVSVDDTNNQTWQSFDEERYSLQNADGTTQVLTADKITFNGQKTTLTIKGLVGSGNAVLIGTVNQRSITSKIKLKKSSQSVIISKSNNPASGLDAVGKEGTTLNDGLEYGNYPFGTRVQDNVISLNVPDVIKIHGIYESLDTNDPQLPSLTSNNMTGPTGSTLDLIVGETFVGQTSGAKAIYLKQNSTSSIGYCYKNNNTFESGEVLIFDESGVNATAADINSGSPVVTDRYNLDSGQRLEIYDYARIVRRQNFDPSNKKLLIYFTAADYDPNDEGILTTANSYVNFNYGNEISQINNIRNTDIIDVRPRVTEYTVAIDKASPFEFAGRSFLNEKHSAKNILASDESMTIDYNIYLGRADRIFVKEDSNIEIKLGAPAEIPELPDILPGALNIANVYNPPYLFNIKDSKTKFVNHKRYQMSDISKLEKRIQNLEYYTSLNLLEQSTLNSFVSDANGLNRFKSGIFIDNFSSFLPQDTTIGIRNSIDPVKKVLRPAHYSTAINLQVGNSTIPGLTGVTASNADSRFADVSGQNIRRTGNVISLNYTDQAFITQPYATRIENVTPFLVTYYNGSIALEPTADIWVSTQKAPEPRDVTMEGSFQAVSDAIQSEVTTNEDGLRIGVAPTMWNSWETTGVNLDLTGRQQTETFAAASRRNGGEFNNLLQGQDANNSTVTSTTIDGSINLSQNRTGIQQTVTEVINTESLGDRIVSRDILHFMRQRNIQFTGRRLKPFTSVFAFFDSVDISNFITPKLLEISMVSGTFQVGETVTGRMRSTSLGPISDTSPTITFRVASSNHKYGPYDNSNDFYTANPYQRGVNVASSYSQSSTTLNVDTFSLQSEEFPQFAGFVRSGMILTGANGAEAIITDVNIITDNVGTVIGCFNVPSSNDDTTPEFVTGRNVFRLSSSSLNSLIKGSTTTAAQEIFYSQGDIDNTEEVTLSLRNARVETIEDSDVRTLDNQIDFDIVNNVSLRPPPPPPRPPDPPRRSDPDPPRRGDPLAQTFTVDDSTGVFVNKIDVFFQSKDDIYPVTCQIRETTLGTPNSKILAYSEVELTPDFVNISEDGSVSTTFTFESPVYLKGKAEYAFILLSSVTSYNVWISRLGEADVTTLASESSQVLVTSQPILGSLFKSQNSNVWTPSQYEDLKFVLHRCDFVGSGNVQFYNPELPTDLESISRDGITAISRSVGVGIGTTVNDNDLTYPLSVGNKVTQINTNASGTLERFSGIGTGNLILTNVGSGYTPSSGQFTFSGIGLTSLTGSGQNATANITVNNGVAIAATVLNGGRGYQVGDVLQPLTFGVDQLGANMQLSVGIVSVFNEIILSNVQGDFSTDVANYLVYTNNNGNRDSINAGVGGSVTPSEIDVLSDGLHLKVFQRNHGMYSEINRVKINSVESSITPTALLVDYSKDSTASISIANTSNFGTFENVGVSNTNPGFVKINNEIIKYEGVTSGTGVSGTLTGIGRAFESTVQSRHTQNDLVFKYEFNNVSLRRINTIHNLNDSTVVDSIGIDEYHVKIDMTKNGTIRTGVGGTFIPKTNYLSSGIGGGSLSKGTYNLPYSVIVPSVTSAVPEGTSINGSVRTISETSVSGTESSFIDQGYQDVTFMKKNYFESQRMVASQTNENDLLTNLPGSKSFTMNMDLLSYDKRLSPFVDLDKSSVIFVSNRVNGPIVNFATDSRVSSIPNDPNSMIYVSKLVELENPATSLKVFIDGYIANTSDLRMFFALNQELNANETIFIPFPGFQNIDTFGNVINPANSDATADKKMFKSDNLTPEPAINDFKEYIFTMENLAPFRSFRLKMIGTSTNQTVVPQFRNLRAIALA